MLINHELVTMCLSGRVTAADGRAGAEVGHSGVGDGRAWTAE